VANSLAEYPARQQIARFIVRAVWMRPAVSTLGLWVSSQIKNLNITLPKRLALKNFSDS